MLFVLVLLFALGQCLGVGNMTMKRQWKETSRGWNGWSSSHESSHGSHHHPVHYYPQQHHGNNNMDLYSLLGSLGFASLLGVTLLVLATRNTSGRRRKRSLFDDDDDLMTPPEGIENIYFGSSDPVKLY